VEALEQRARLDPNRLPRGRDYARSGAVGELILAPGEARARVQGRKTEPYEVRIRYDGSPTRNGTGCSPRSPPGSAASRRSGPKIVCRFDCHHDRLTDNPASRCHYHHAGCQEGKLPASLLPAWQKSAMLSILLLWR